MPLLASQFNKPTKTVRVIALAHLARAFQPYESIEKLLDNSAEFVAGKGEYAKPFDITIEASWQTWKFRTGAIHSIDENLALAWVGIDNSRFMRDYDSTGLVYFDVPEEISAALDYRAKTGRKLDKDLEAQVRTHIERFRAMSHLRILTHAKRLYNTMLQSHKVYRTNKLEPDDPNDMELLLGDILHAEIEKARARRARTLDKFRQTSEALAGESSLLRA